MKLGLDPSRVARPLHAFVIPRYQGEQADDFDLPIHDLFVEHCLNGYQNGQLIIKAPRGGGSTTCLHWLKNWLDASKEFDGPQLEMFDLDALIGARRVLVAEKLRNGSAVLFADLSLIPFRTNIEETFNSLIRDGVQIDGDDTLSLRACRMVVATSEGTFEPLCFDQMENGRTVHLASWSEDEWIELLGSTAVLRERRKELFPQLAALRGKLPDMGIPRTARWLLEAALTCRKTTSLTVADLFAEVLDQMPLNVIQLLRQMEGDLAFEEDIRKSLDEEALTFDEALTYFRVSNIDAEDLFIGNRELFSLGASIFKHLEKPQRLIPFALTGLGDFMHAGVQLKSIAEDRVLWPLREESFSFIEEMVSEQHKARLRDWMLEKHHARKKISVAATLLWRLGEVPRISPDKHSYLFFEASLLGVPWDGENFYDVQFLSCKLRNASFRGSNLSSSLICGTALQGADFEGAEFEGSRIAECNLRGGRFIGSNLSECEITRSQLDLAVFNRTNLTASTIHTCTLGDTQFINCQFLDARLKLLDLRECRFEESNFTKLVVEDCNLSFLELPNFNGPRSGFYTCDLSNTSFQGGQLSHAKFKHCRANEINFEGADLKESVFIGVNFHAGSSRCGMLSDKPALEGNMTKYYAENQVEDAWVSPESVRHANFAGADLRGAKFIETNLFRVDFRGALLDQELEITARKHKAILDD